MAWETTPGSGDLVMASGDTLATGVVSAQVAHVLDAFVGNSASVASGSVVVAIANATTIPSSLGGLLGGVLYVQSGHLKYQGSQGTVTTVASA